MYYLPEPIIDYIHKLTVENRSPAYLLVQKDGRLSKWGGKLSLYGFQNLQKGEYIDRQILFLTGLLPIHGSPVILPCIETDSGIYADVHIFSTDKGDWILLLDATLYENQRSLVQQKGNDLSLIRQKQAKIFNRHFNYYPEIPLGFWHLLEKGERRDVSILQATICGFNAYIENKSPQIVFSTLNSYISSMMQPLLDEGGMVDRILGDAVITLFGILPASGSPSECALKAAVRVIEAVKEIGKVRQLDGLIKFDTAISITSGSVILGLIGSHNQKTFVVAGNHVKLAEQLGQNCRASEIIIDASTFNQIGKMQKYFYETTMFKTEIEPISIYSYLVT